MTLWGWCIWGCSLTQQRTSWRTLLSCWGKTTGSFGKHIFTLWSFGVWDSALASSLPPGCGQTHGLWNSISFFILLKILLCIICVCECMHTPHTVCGGQRTTWSSQFSSSMVWVLGIKPRSWGLVTSMFTCWAICQPLILILIEHLCVCVFLSTGCSLSCLVFPSLPLHFLAAAGGFSGWSRVWSLC